MTKKYLQYIIDFISNNFQNTIQNDNLPDGSYDMKMVVEFWPQRLFYIGFAVSGITLFDCVGYLVYDWKKK